MILCPCGCGHDINDRQAQLNDWRHSELVLQGLPPLPDFVPGIGHTFCIRPNRGR